MITKESNLFSKDGTLEVSTIESSVTQRSMGNAAGDDSNSNDRKKFRIFKNLKLIKFNFFPEFSSLQQSETKIKQKITYLGD
jgi:hypothetical protein